MESAIGALGQLGPIGIALVVLIVMWVLNRQTSTRYKELISAYDERLKSLTSELDRQDVIHAKELIELNTEIKGLREDIRVMRAEMEVERSARRRAEEEAHMLKLSGDPRV